VRRFDLRSLRFHDESETWRELPVEVAPFVFGGLEYGVEGGVVELLLHAARVDQRLTLTGSFTTVIVGPCYRCLEDARVEVSARGIEYVRGGESEEDEEEGGEGYVRVFQVDVERWVRDLIADALPLQLLCREDCRGLCAVCGLNLNERPEHAHEE
jgi:uncharacterized protein